MDNKKIIFQVTKTYMKKNRRRTLVTFLGILVMVTLMTAVFVGKDTAFEYMKNAVKENSGSWHYQVYDIDKEQLEKLQALDFVEECEVSKPLGYTEFAQSADPEVTPFLELKQYSDDLYKLMDIKLKEGRYPKNPDEVVISARAISEGANIKVGDTIEANCFERYVHAYTEEEIKAAEAEGKERIHIFFPPDYGIVPGDTKKAPAHFQYYKENALIEMIHEPTGVNKSLKVVGIIEEPYFAAPGQGGYMAMTGIDKTVNAGEKVNAVLTIDLNTKADTYGEIAKILDTTKTPEEREAALETNRGYTTKTGERIPVEKGKIVSNDLLLSFAADGQNGTLNFMMTFTQVFFVVLITAASLVLIYNVFSMSYQERSKYLGMLSSVGATRRQKRWSVYYEVFSLLSLALPIGIGLGLLVIKGGMTILTPYFGNIFGVITANVVAERSFDIPANLVINPINLLLVVIFSIVAVWISAWLPAHKISKIGPVESIRGNETTIKAKKKGYKSYLGLMLKGKPEKLIGTASVERNRTSTKGVIRSITAFISLTLITIFAAGSIKDIFDSEFNQMTIRKGSAYSGYTYAFSDSGFLDNDTYYACRDEIINSKDVTGYIEAEETASFDCIPLKYYKEEYVKAKDEILKMWFPHASEKLLQMYIDGEGDYRNLYSRPLTDIIILKDEEFKEVAKNAGIDLTKYEGSETGPILVYDTLKVSTNDMTFFSNGAEKPDYEEYTIKEPLTVKPGDTIDLTLSGYSEEDAVTNEIKEYPDIITPVEFAGYIKASDIEKYYVLKGDYLRVVMSDTTRKNIESMSPQMGGVISNSYKVTFFNLNTEDSGLLKRLSQIKNELGKPCLWRADMLEESTSFYDAMVKIANIIAICFTVLVAIICLLNLYNSVMGRSLARHRELSVLYSMGMTDKQKNKMLSIENLRLLTKALIKSALITLIFVLCLYKLISLKYMGVQISIHLWTIIVTVLASIVGLMVFTKVCYRQDSKQEIIDEIRRESV